MCLGNFWPDLKSLVQAFVIDFEVAVLGDFLSWESRIFLRNLPFYTSYRLSGGIKHHVYCLQPQTRSTDIFVESFPDAQTFNLYLLSPPTINDCELAS